MLGERPRDRKSTRLNSSHLRISYAVFCLKKKEKKATPRPDDYAAAHQKFEPSPRLYAYAVTPQRHLENAPTYTRFFFFFLMTRRPPIPTLLPYRTLFH